MTPSPHTKADKPRSNAQLWARLEVIERKQQALELERGSIKAQLEAELQKR